VAHSLLYQSLKSILRILIAVVHTVHGFLFVLTQYCLQVCKLIVLYNSERAFGLLDKSFVQYLPKNYRCKIHHGLLQ
jgi:hypothetical protein